MRCPTAQSLWHYCLGCRELSPLQEEIMSVQRKKRGHQYVSIVTMHAAHAVKNMTSTPSQFFCSSRSAFWTSLYSCMGRGVQECRPKSLSILFFSPPCPAYLHLKHKLVASDAELRLEQDGELLFRDGFRSSSVRSLDPL